MRPADAGVACFATVECITAQEETDMTIPGFNAERSLYASRICYCAAGAESSAKEHSVLPMSIPAHHSAPGSSAACNTCRTNCDNAAASWFISAEIGCSPLLAIPFAGGIWYAACLEFAEVFIGSGLQSCLSGCFALGGPCCPVGCGSSCCNTDETCSDTSQGLCCSAGTQPCGANCCQGDEVCLNGVCCPPGNSVCSDGTCCDNACAQCQNGTCVAGPDNTTCPDGTCCGGKCTNLMDDSNNCGACGKICPPGTGCWQSHCSSGCPPFC